MIRWSFLLEQRELNIEVNETEEDNRIANGLLNPDKFLYLKNETFECFVNLREIKIVVRQEFADEEKESEGKVECENCETLPPNPPPDPGFIRSYIPDEGQAVSE